MSATRRMSVDRSDPGRLPAQVSAWADTLAAQNYNSEVICRRERDALRFATWCGEGGIFRGENLTATLVQTYTKTLETLAAHAIHSRLVALRSFCHWLTKCSILSADPSVLVRTPKRQGKERMVLSRTQVEALMGVPNTGTAEGVRDRALLEVLYSTGLRRQEVCRLRLCDLPPGSGVVRVVRGKGGRDRMVPIGTRAGTWVSAYLRKGRPVLVSRCGTVSEGLFLGNHGKSLSVVQTYEIVRVALDAIGVGNVGACHLLRHAFATHLLQAGAAVEAIGSMLGHSGLRTTPTYTRVDADTLAAAVGRMRAGGPARHPVPSGRGYDANLSGFDPHLSG